MYCHVLRDCNGAVLALEIISKPAQAGYGRFVPTADLASLDVDVERDLLTLLALRQSPVRSKLRVEMAGGTPRLVSAGETGA